MPTKTIFLGSNWESLEILKELHKNRDFEIVSVITQPDRPFGRKKQLKPTEVKEFAQENSIPVLLADKGTAVYKEALETYKPDLIVCIAFGEIVPDFFLEAPKHKAINVHFSVLPKYRGAVPIQMAVLNGDEKTGISIVQMVQEMDAGPVLATYEEPILPTDTNQSLRERLVERSRKELPKILKLWISGEITALKQDSRFATFCYQKDIAKDKAEIKWDQMSPEQIERMIRAFIPWPIAWTVFEGKRLKIFEAGLVQEDYLMPGEFKSKGGRLLVGTRDSSKQIELLRIQIEGKKEMSSREFLSGKEV